MGHPAIDNETPFLVEPVFLLDEEGRSLLVTVIKNTYTFSEGGVQPAEEQPPVLLAGEYWGKPESSSFKLEPEAARLKPATDVALIGHAHGRGGTEVIAGIQVGPLRKTVRVTGDRLWFKSMGSVTMTSPRKFDTIPLQWERAFGGWDRAPKEETKHRCEPRNPVGVSFRSSASHFEEGLRLPNLEDPADLVGSFGQRVTPAGFGFTCGHWEPRTRYAGTYDEAWAKGRSPLLPRDFDRRFFNAAAPGLTAPGYLKGDEPVALISVTPSGRAVFRLPGESPPRVQVELSFRGDVVQQAKLDTVVIDADQQAVSLLWRTEVPLRTGPHDVKTIRVGSSAEA